MADLFSTPAQPEKRSIGSMSIEQAIVSWLSERGERGSTCDEFEEVYGVSHQTASAAFNKMKRERKIMGTDRTEPTRSGHSAEIYVLTGGFERRWGL